MFANVLRPDSRVAQLCAAMQREMDALVMCLHPDWAGQPDRMSPSMDVTVWKQPLYRSAWSMRRWLKQHRVGVVWAYNIPPLAHATMAMLGSGQRLIYNFVGADIQSNRELDYGFRRTRFRDQLFRLLMQRPHRLVCMSPIIADLAQDAGIDSSRLVTIPNMFDLAADFPSATGDEVQELRNHLELDDERVILTVARHAVIKRIDQLIWAFAQVRKRHPDAVLLVVGKGELLSANRAIVDEVGLGGAVRFIEQVPRYELRVYYASADVSCNVSDQDAFCNPVVEAISQGTPVVVGPNVGAGRYVTDEPFCRIADPDRPETIAEAIDGTLAEDVKHHYGERARQRARDFDTSRVMPQWRALFEEMGA